MMGRKSIGLMGRVEWKESRMNSGACHRDRKY